MSTDILELSGYNDKKIGKRSNFLGKSKISGNTFVKSGSETLVYYPLEKRSVVSQVGLKISYVDQEIVPLAPSQEEKLVDTDLVTEENPTEKAEEEKESEAVAEETKKEEENKPPQEAKNEEKPSENQETQTPATTEQPTAVTEKSPITLENTQKSAQLWSNRRLRGSKEHT